MELEVRCTHCHKGVFRINRSSAFTTACDHCDHLNLGYRVVLFGLPRVILPSDQDESLVSTENTIDQVISYYLDHDDIGALKIVQAEDIADLVKSLCALYLNKKSRSPRNTVFSWAEQAAPGDEDVTQLGFAIAKRCKEKMEVTKRQISAHAARKGYWDQIKLWNLKSECPYCGGGQCEWCNYTGVSWRYWLAVQKLPRDGSPEGLSAFFY